MSVTINWVQGEQKTITFTYKKNGVAFDITGITSTLVIELSPGIAMITKNDGDFDKTDVLLGQVHVDLLVADTATETPDTYGGGIKAVFTGSDVDKEEEIVFILTRSKTP